jgi:hypothetical protein
VKEEGGKLLKLKKNSNERYLVLVVFHLFLFKYYHFLLLWIAFSGSNGFGYYCCVGVFFKFETFISAITFYIDFFPREYTV